MKHMKRIAALALAIMMLLSLATTAFAAEGDDNYTITINNELDGHTYEAYQIFKGDLSKASENDSSDGTNAVLSNIEWGSGISDEGKAKLQQMYGAENAAGVAEALNESNVKAFAAEVSKYLTTTFASTSTKTNNQYVISGLEAGYYLVKDQNGSLNNDHDAYTSYIIEVVENSTVNPKSAFPTVDKQVQDEVADKEANADANGWGETADHAINESFQFKLIANLPQDTNFAAYETYKVIFNDTMSNGITFEQIVSVTVDNVPLTSGYACSATTGQVGGSWTLTITDIKSIDGVNLTDGAVIEVIYSAHLNENAAIGNVPNNKNTVNLQYSNNPNASGEGHTEVGKTPDDTVWVFTYEMKNIKVDGDEQPLADAGFKLYADEACTNEIAVVFDNSLNAYRLAKDGEAGQEMISAAETGIFNIVGLDVGTYYLKETTTPAGYNTCPVVTVVITAAHTEAESQTTASTHIVMTQDGTATEMNKIINNAGVTLPETGGIGTTLFYALGGLMVVAAAVLLVTRKRMANFE